MVKQAVKIMSKSGLHLRPASNLCKLAIEYESNIIVKKGNGEYNAKSIISLLSSCTKEGDEVEVVCDGTDESEALKAVIEYIEKSDW